MGYNCVLSVLAPDFHAILRNGPLFAYPAVLLCVTQPGLSEYMQVSPSPKATASKNLFRDRDRSPILIHTKNLTKALLNNLRTLNHADALPGVYYMEVGELRRHVNIRVSHQILNRLQAFAF